MENDILKHRKAVQENILKSFGAETSEDSLEKSFEDEVNPFEMEAYKSELTKAGLDEFEKAKHQDGDMHPNGKWVWRQSANGGKGDWRVAKKGSSSTSGGSGSAGSTGPLNTSSSYFSKLSNSLIEKYSKKKESVSLSDIEEFYEDFLRDRGQEPTRKVYANEAKKTYDAIVGNWNKKSSNTVTHDINGTKVTVTKNSDGSYTLEANGKKVKSDDPSFFVNGTNLKPRVKAALAKEVGLQTKKPILSQNDTTSKPKGNAKSTSDFDSLSSAKTQLEVNKFWSNLLTLNSGKGQNIAGKFLDSIKESGYRNLSGGMTASGKEVYTYTNKDADKNIKILPAIDGVVIKTNDKREVLKVSDFKNISDFKKKFEETVLGLSGNVSNKKAIQ